MQMLLLSKVLSNIRMHRCQVTKTFRSLDRKAMIQVQPIASRPLLLALTDDGINLHTLPGMQLKFQVGAQLSMGGIMPRSKGRYVYKAWLLQLVIEHGFAGNHE